MARVHFLPHLNYACQTLTNVSLIGTVSVTASAVQIDVSKSVHHRQLEQGLQEQATFRPQQQVYIVCIFRQNQDKNTHLNGVTVLKSNKSFY